MRNAVTKIVEYDPNADTFRWSGYVIVNPDYPAYGDNIIGSKYNCALTEWGMNYKLDKAIRRYARNLRKENGKRGYVSSVDISGKV